MASAEDGEATTTDRSPRRLLLPALLPAGLWRDLSPYLGSQRRILIIGGVLTLLGSFAGLAQPVAAKLVIDGLETEGGVAGLLIVLTAFVLLAAALNAGGYYLLMRVSEQVVFSVRRRLVRRALWLRVPESGRYPPGDLLSRLSSDTTLMRSAVGSAVVETVNGALVLVAILVMMAVMDWVLLLTTLGTLLFAALSVGLLMPRLERASRGAQEGVATLSEAMERSLGAFRTVKAAGAETAEAASAERGADRALEHGLRAGRIEAVVSTVATLAVQVAFLAVLGVGGARVAAGAIGLGTLIAFLLYLFYLLPPLGAMVSAVSQLNVCAAALRRIGEVLSLRVEEGAPGADRPLPPHDAGPRPDDGDGEPLDVVFEDVVFRYAADKEAVHHGVSFTAPAAGMTALVGPSGAGKSTAFALIERFYEPESGRVLVGGRDTADWSLGALRSEIGFVEQDAPVLAGSLRENLCLGNPGVAPERLDDALRVARLTELVDRLPQGLETQVGHRGSRLSGGERQRVAIARALLRAPRLLLLDEATSQLDARNEAALREAVEEISTRTTVLVVAHRLSTVMSASRILVMEQGRVRAVGSHTELVENDDLYRELAATQMLAAGRSTDDDAVIG
ncbi:ABC transporter ATP-binding protein [Nocardiopsis sp. MG754419]|uniref:ABC transporter ATP-binding protein n=1 Tax=Nocardiopsis sp. MG754419 TaxID=2259865 RepID=UPI001BAB7B8D|nr:ABC transporter ATP-binding protein [Nocardiopsis sp. MG754419]MBR8743440.1 ABC transporter ATP-binding protein [Nocardiopsis sp. MG754419]